jgi:hypothetical protein
VPGRKETLAERRDLTGVLLTPFHKRISLTAMPVKMPPNFQLVRRELEPHPPPQDICSTEVKRLSPDGQREKLHPLAVPERLSSGNRNTGVSAIMQSLKRRGKPGRQDHGNPDSKIMETELKWLLRLPRQAQTGFRRTRSRIGHRFQSFYEVRSTNTPP